MADHIACPTCGVPIQLGVTSCPSCGASFARWRPTTWDLYRSSSIRARLFLLAVMAALVIALLAHLEGLV